MKKIFVISSFLVLLLKANLVFAEGRDLITFVDTGNTGRSPMAEYLSSQYIPNTESYEFQSRATALNPANPQTEANAITVMQDIYIDMTGRTAMQLTSADVAKSKIVLTMTKAHKEAIITGTANNPPIAPNAKNVFMLSECADGTQTDVTDAFNKALPIYVLHAIKLQSI